ncbi:MAG: hypothetical protein HY261_04675 [Chloroflexi bacterium]|nr:hypothetical protein [Chloroflexota bacterium]
MTGVDLVVIAATKFTHGAWLVMLIIPLLLYAFRRFTATTCWWPSSCLWITCQSP